MESIGLIFTMLIAILLSGVIGRVLPWGVPLPLIQILFGIVIAGVFKEGISLNPEVFFLLFIPPLLFLDGWRIPKDALMRDKAGIFHLAFGLVFITVLGLGHIIHWMIPAMPLAVSFALAAIVSPTDPVAVAGITRRLPVPQRLMSILEGEALFNDASGLVAFRMAVLAAMTGAFSLTQAASSFIWVALAGLMTGVMVTWGLSFIRERFTRRFGEEQGSELLLSILTPFAAYIVAEKIGGSGILSAVAAGLTMSTIEFSGRIAPLTRVRRTALWDTLQFTLNGIMFVLLGEQLPGIFTNAVRLVQETGHHNPWWLVIYALVICLSLTALRFVWVSLSLFLMRLFTHTPETLATQWRHILILSFAGVRGAVTLAGVLTLPLLLPDGAQFPGRDLAIFLAATVIIISLILASVVLPWLLKDLAPTRSTTASHEKQTHMAIQTAHAVAAEHIDELITSLDKHDLDQAYYDEVKTRLLSDFANSFTYPTDSTSLDYKKHHTERLLRLKIITAARQSIYQLAKEHKISDELARDLVQKLDLDEVRFN
ncbi:CPA1 family monovalent cation:H+ antiporter [Paenalcaligenes hominis]|uniref:CPA1 family monovalent cation:H+ antiporter n=1 Tax=Paenalcaligenes hominis TaxID=643674 RepID=A0ABX0WTH3_9BURK|nr:Na+/H+ antiporter [Paenalcaligenes hominis]NJB66059.1 CPA1 family monovalent cation:H+ antiporter [Paenalcaligenes hominis]GGE71719.1 Na+:H+ antiporter [Paenalcaligenes hominis]